MKKRIFNVRNSFLLGAFVVSMIVVGSNSIFAESTEKNPMKVLEDINIATKMIQDKKYDEAKTILEKIDDVDFYYLKNQHLGDIAFLKKNYDESLSFYNLAQFHSKDKVMHDYMSKKMAYIITVKKGVIEKEIVQ